MRWRGLVATTFGLLTLVLPSVVSAQQMDSHRGYVAVNGGLCLPGLFYGGGRLGWVGP